MDILRRFTIPVLLYHAVPRAGDPSDPLAVAQERFLTHLDTIAASGHTAITIGTLASGLRGESRLPDRPVSITFDDAYEDTLEATDLILERGLCASVYVTTGQVNTESMIRPDQLKNLAARPGIQLGAHTVTHPFLDEIDPGGIEREVSDSKAQLERLVGSTIDTFAYPYGAYDRRVRSAVIAAGYHSAAAVKNALSHPDDDPWAIARWTVKATTTDQQIARLLEGRDAPYAWRNERMRTRGYRLARRLRRRIIQGVVRTWR
jgi:peptidoglycan/xylan/chitin deacetylase (PgdA/CDA1 family)